MHLPVAISSDCKLHRFLPKWGCCGGKVQNVGKRGIYTKRAELMSRPMTLPILKGFNPDPSIVRVDDDFFLVTSSFEYFPGIPLYHSQDAKSWTLIGHVLTRRSQLDLRTCEPSAGIWAPTIRYHNGMFYVTACCYSRYVPSAGIRVFPLGFVVTTSKNAIWDQSKWSDPVYFDTNGFDQDLFWDDDGKVYHSVTRKHNEPCDDPLLKNFGIHVSQVDLATGTSLSPPMLIRKSPSGIAEGSHIFKRGKYYYLVCAEGGTEEGHHEMIFRATSVLGPYEACPYPLLKSSNKPGSIYSAGHLDIVQSSAQEQEWIAVFLGYRHSREQGKFVYSALGRESFLVSVSWENDWPSIKLPQVQLRDENAVQWKELLSHSQLSLGWYSKHTPLRQDYSLSERPGYIRLFGNVYTLDSPEHPAALFRKQPEFYGCFSASLDFHPAKEAYEAGVVVWYSVFSYVSFGLRLRDGKKVLVVTKRIVGSIQEDCHKVIPLSYQSLVKFKITSDSTAYTLSACDVTTNAPLFIEETLTEELTRIPPTGALFTGMMFGIYSTGNGEPCLSPADFTDISWTP